jgi:hypothetical protein
LALEGILVTITTAFKVGSPSIWTFGPPPGNFVEFSALDHQHSAYKLKLEYCQQKSEAVVLVCYLDWQDHLCFNHSYLQSGISSIWTFGPPLGNNFFRVHCFGPT